MREKPSDLTKLVLKKSKFYIIIKALTCIIYRAIAIIIPVLLSNAINEVTGKNYNNAINIALIALILAIIFRIFDVINTYTWHNLYNKMYERFTSIGVKETVNNSLYSLSRINVGEFLNIMSTDISVICEFYCNLIMRTIRILEITIIFVYFFKINFYIGLTAIVVIIICLLLILLFSNIIEKLNKDKSYKLDERGFILNEMMLSIKEIKNFNLLNIIKNRVNKSTKKYTEAFKKQRIVEDIAKYIIVGFVEIVRWTLFIYCIKQVSIGAIQIGTILVIYNYYGQLLDGYSEFATINIGIRQLKVSENRFFKLAKYSHMIKTDGVELENVIGKIKFNNIVYGDKLNPIFNKLSLEIKANSINTITGNSDSGISGIADLLLKLNTQHSGTIKLDGVDIRDINDNEYFNLISDIDEQPTFFKLSVKDNLSISNSTFDKCISICKLLNIHDDIIKLKYGYDTILNTNDDTLKPMTKYKLYLAKILIKNTKIIIFNKTLDNLENIDDILNILNEKKNSHTIIIITNSKKIIKLSDNNIIIDNGKVKK